MLCNHFQQPFSTAIVLSVFDEGMGKNMNYSNLEDVKTPLLFSLAELIKSESIYLFVGIHVWETQSRQKSLHLCDSSPCVGKCDLWVSYHTAVDTHINEVLA